MIRIGKPYITKNGNRAFLNALIENEKEHIKEVIWYSVKEEYESYLCDEVADAFLSIVFLPAIWTNQDIEIETCLSEKLYYNIQNTLNGGYPNVKKVKISCKSVINPNYKPFAVGTGCSLGVDSFASILYNSQKWLSSDLKLTHLALFNVGAYGSFDLEKTEKSFQKDFAHIKQYADEVKLPIIDVNSNLGVLYKKIRNDQSHTFRNMSVVLALQKLFKTYYYASSYPIYDTHLTLVDPGHYDNVTLPQLSTQSTKLIVANANFSRVEKTAYIANNKLVQKYLDVCLSEVLRNDNYKTIQKTHNKINCSCCDKCLRTMLTLELLGNLESFTNVFSIEVYKKHKDKYIGKVLACKNYDIFFKEIYDLIKEKKYNIPFKSRIYYLVYKLYSINIVSRLYLYLIKASNLVIAKS